MTFAQFEHTDIKKTITAIINHDPLLARALNMESLVTDQPWTDSMLNVTKLALFFTYNLITEAARPKGVIKCSEEGT